MRFSSGIALEASIILILLPASIVVNRSLGAEERGILAAMLLMPLAVSALVTGQWQRILRAQITSKAADPAQMWARTQVYSLLMSAVGVLVSAILIGLQQQLTEEQRYQAMLAALFIVPSTLYSLFLADFLAAINKLRASYAVRLAPPLVYLAAIPLWLWQGLSLPVVLVLNVLMPAAACLVGWLYLRSLSMSASTVQPFDALFRSFLGSFPPYALEVLGLNAAIWSLTTFVGHAETGAYAAFALFAIPAKVVSNGLINVATGRLDWTDPTKVSDFVRKGLLFLLAAGVLLAIGTLLAGRIIVVAVLGESFGSATWMLPYIVLGGFLTSAAFFVLVAILLQGRQSLYLKIQSADGLVRIVLIVWGCFIAGALGILVAICLASAIKLAACLVTLTGTVHSSQAGMVQPDAGPEPVI